MERFIECWHVESAGALCNRSSFKTFQIQMFEHNRFSDNFKPTIGADFSNKEITIDGRIVML